MERQAASSSLLYSREFYRLARKRLAPDGVLQQWTAEGDATVLIAMYQALADVFPEVRALPGLDFGLHLLASGRRLELRPAERLAAQLPVAAVRDLIEWGPTRETSLFFARSVYREAPIAAFAAQHEGVPALQDDRPINEYDAVRKILGRGTIARQRVPAAR